MKKTILAILVAVVVLCFTGCFNSDEPCELCGNTPTQGYQGTDGVDRKSTRLNSQSR